MKISFVNQGVLDPRMIQTFGVNVKETTNPFGYFGTGLKYAISVLLREKQEITIYSDGNEYKFHTKSDTLRGKDFDFVYMNDIVLPFTLELGKTWSMWKAYRELYCNCMDENGYVTANPIVTSSSLASTIVQVNGDAFEAIHHNRASFILDTTVNKPLWSTPFVDIYPGANDNLFFKGIKVYNFEKLCMYTYNFKKDILLTEDRSVSNIYSLYFDIINNVCRHGQRDLIRAIGNCPKEFTESTFPWLQKMQSEELLFQVYNEIYSEYGKFQDENIRNKVMEIRRGRGIDKVEKPKLSQEAMIDKSKLILNGMGVNISRYPIVFVENMGAEVVARADTKSMVIELGPKAFDQGVDYLASTILEEFVHLDHGFSDKSYEMQTFLFDLCIAIALGKRYSDVRQKGTLGEILQAAVQQLGTSSINPLLVLGTSVILKDLDKSMMLESRRRPFKAK